MGTILIAIIALSPFWGMFLFVLVPTLSDNIKINKDIKNGRAEEIIIEKKNYKWDEIECKYCNKIYSIYLKECPHC